MLLVPDLGSSCDLHQPICRERRILVSALLRDASELRFRYFMSVASDFTVGKDHSSAFFPFGTLRDWFVDALDEHVALSELVFVFHFIPF